MWEKGTEQGCVVLSCGPASPRISCSGTCGVCNKVPTDKAPDAVIYLISAMGLGKNLPYARECLGVGGRGEADDSTNCFLWATVTVQQVTLQLASLASHIRKPVWVLAIYFPSTFLLMHLEGSK